MLCHFLEAKSNTEENVILKDDLFATVFEPSAQTAPLLVLVVLWY
jgi:hypothetical protein